MARLDRSAVLAEVSTLLTANGGKMRFADLSDSLSDQGKNAYISVVLDLAARGELVKSMQFHEGDVIAKSTVSLPGGGS